MNWPKTFQWSIVLYTLARTNLLCMKNWATQWTVTVAINDLLCMKNAGAQIAMDFS